MTAAAERKWRASESGPVALKDFLVSFLFFYFEKGKCAGSITGRLFIRVWMSISRKLEAGTFWLPGVSPGRHRLNRRTTCLVVRLGSLSVFG